MTGVQTCALPISFFGNRLLSLSTHNSDTQLLKLPVASDEFGVPHGTIRYNISYTFQSSSQQYNRCGNFFITADVDNNLIDYSDSYDCIGLLNDDVLKLSFTAVFLDEAYEIYTGAPGQVASSILVQYINELAGDAGYFSYTYSSLI